MLEIIIEQSNVPVVVMQVSALLACRRGDGDGADAVLVNTAIAVAGDPWRWRRRSGWRHSADASHLKPGWVPSANKPMPAALTAFLVNE